MNTEKEPEEGVCIVSFDAGGPGSISQLLMLKELMIRLAFDLDADLDELYPADYFDLMGGVGFGGLSALLLGRLHMHIDEAIMELAKIGSTIFPKVADEIASPQANMTKLRNAVEDLLQRRNMPLDTKLYDKALSGSKCKVVVYAATASNLSHCHPFRTYPSRQARHNCTIADAACAIIAIPHFFSPVAIGPSLMKQEFVGVPPSAHNPMREMLKEAWLVFGEKQVSLLLSLGSGQPAVQSLGSLSVNLDGRPNLIARFAQDNERVARELSEQLRDVSAYVRLNVDKGMEIITTSEWHDLGSIVSHTNVYLETTGTNVVDSSVLLLGQKIGTISLRELNGVSMVVTAKFRPEEYKNHATLSAFAIKQMKDIVQEGVGRITLVDAIGNHIPIPMELCRTHQLFVEVIGAYFRHQKPPGSAFVERGDYELVYGDQRKAIEPGAWTYAVKPGLAVEMSMILRKRNQDLVRCPRCRAGSEYPAKGGWITCSSCFGHFQARDEDMKENEDVVVTPATQSRNAPQASRSAESRHGGEDEWNKFRLISMVNLIKRAIPDFPRRFYPDDPFLDFIPPGAYAPAYYAPPRLGTRFALTGSNTLSAKNTVVKGTDSSPATSTLAARRTSSATASLVDGRAVIVRMRSATARTKGKGRIE